MKFFFLIIVAVIIIYRIITRSEKYIPRYLYGWGSNYKEKLNLTKKEKRILNFVSVNLDFLKYDRLAHVNFYIEELVGFYLTVSREFNLDKVHKTKYLQICQYCDFILRKRYICNIYSDKGKLELESHLSESEKSEITRLSTHLRDLTLEEERKLFNTDTKRRSTYYDKLTNEFSDGQEFYEAIKWLESLNTAVGVKHNIYHKAYRFAVDKDKTVSLKLYIHYLSINSGALKHLNISKTNQKKLFKETSQQMEFEQIVETFKKDNNLEEALQAIDNIYAVKRKKITLDVMGIDSAKEDSAMVVGLLNEYLEDEENVPKPEITIDNIDSTNKLSPIQEEFIQFFISNSYQLTQGEIDNFANKKGVFTSQLIDGFNEQFYEELDDLLIEEDEANYILNKDYYQQIIKA